MKKFILIALIALFSYGCAERTHILSSIKASKSEKKSVDSAGRQNSQIVDKSTITTERSADTTVTITGKSITGEIDTRSAGDGETVSQHFENDDLGLDLFFNKNTGKATAKATPKPKPVNIKVHEKQTVNNDITKKDFSQSKVKTNTEIKADTTSKKVNDHTDPAKAVSGLRAVVIWFLVICGVLVGILIILKRYFKIF